MMEQVFALIIKVREEMEKKCMYLDLFFWVSAIKWVLNTENC